MGKRALSLLIAIVFMLSLMPAMVSADTASLSGSGTSADPYLVASYADLCWIASNNTTNTGFSGKYFKQTANIDMSYTNTVAWVPIGNNSTNFKGTYDGGGYTIEGLFIDATTSNNGVFGVISTTATIQDLGVVNVDITCSANNSTTGAVVGNNYGKLLRCYSNGTIKANGNTGGLVGYQSSGSTKDCFSLCNVSNNGGTYDQFGGLIGKILAGTVTNSYARGSVTAAGRTYVGGITGVNNGSIYNCFATGTVTGAISVGGIAGSNSGTEDYVYTTDSTVDGKRTGTISHYYKDVASSFFIMDSSYTTVANWKSTYPWDMTNTWIIDTRGSTNNGFPCLKASQVVPKYSITYNANNATSGSVPTDLADYRVDTTVSVSANTGSLARYGYTFSGWNTTESGSGTSYAAGATLTMSRGDITLYAQWELNTSMWAWQLVGSAGISKSTASFVTSVVDSSGSPYIAYRDSGNSNKATVMKYNGNSWEPVGNAGFSAGAINYTSLAIDSSGKLYIAYKDDGNSNKATVMKYNGSSWETVGSAGFSAGTINHMSLAIDSSGIPYVAYQDVTYSSKATVMKYNGSNWEVVGSTGFSIGAIYYASLVIDNGGIPYVAYQDVTNTGKATVMKYNGSGWITVGNAGFSAGRVNFVSLVVDSAGTPYVAYQDTINSNKATVMKYNGSAWETVGGAGFSAGDTQYESLKMDGSGILYLAFQDYAGNSNKATAMKYNGSRWVNVGSAAFSDGPVQFTSLVIDSSGTPYVAYVDMSKSYKATVMKYGLTPFYSVSYNGNGADSGSVPTDSGSYKTAQTTTVQGNTGDLTKAGCVFAGWNTKVDGSGTSYAAGSTLTIASADVTLYAQWNTNYSVSYDGNGADSGTVPTDSGNYISGQTATVQDNTGGLTKAGYTFVGWNTATDGSGTGCVAGGTLTIGNASPTLYAQWEQNTDSWQWQLVGVRGFSAGSAASTSLVLDGSGTPYVAYKDLGNSSKATVMKFSEGAWEAVGIAGISEGMAQYTALAISSGGTLYIAYQDGANSNKATVLKYNGSAWETVGSAGFSSGAIAYTSLAISSGGTPYIAYIDGANSNKATVMKYDGSSWVSVGSQAFSPGTVSELSIALDGSGTPYVAFHNYSAYPYGAFVMKYDGSNWVNVGTGKVSSNGGAYISMAINSTGIPYVVYADDSKGFKATVMKYDGSSWVSVGSPGFTQNSIGYTSIAFNSSDKPYMAFVDYSVSNKVSVVRYNGAGWVYVGGAGFSSGTGYPVKLALNSDGVPYVGFGDAGKSSKATVMKYSQPQTYTVTYNGNGSSGGSVPTDSGIYDYGNSVTVLGNTGSLANTGYTFSGWNTKADKSGTSYLAGSTFTMPGGDVTLYAMWNSNSYTLSYNGNGNTAGSVPSPSDNSCGGTVTLSANTGILSRDGYTFTGWNIAVDGSGTDYAESGTLTMPSNNLTLYAKWTANTYTVTYLDNSSTGGAVPTDSSAYTYLENVTASSNSGSLVKTGCTFAGWNTAADGSGTDYAAGSGFVMPSSNLVLYAKWVSAVFTVSYNGNGNSSGTVPLSDSAFSGAEYTTSLNTGSLTRTGYTFAGWNTAAAGNGTTYSAGASFTMSSANVILYAKWTAADYYLSYDGNGKDSGTVPFGDSFTYLENVAVSGTGSMMKAGYTFAGWNTAADGSGTSYASGTSFNMPAGDVTLYAQWTAVPYTITYSGNGNSSGSVPSSSGGYSVNQSVTLGAVGDLQKTGYTFSGWNTAANGLGASYEAGGSINMPAGNLMLYAQWTATPYTLSYNGNGSSSGTEPSSGTYTINQSVTLYTVGDLEKTGYNFVGWNTASDGNGTDYASGSTFVMPAGNATLYAKWVNVLYNVVYTGNGNDSGSVPSDASTYSSGSSVTVFGNSGSLSRGGYNFAGWNTAEDASGSSYTGGDTFLMPEGDVILYAEWTPISYSVTYDGNGSTSGSAPSADSRTVNQTVTVSMDGSLVKTGSTFTGWNTSALGTGVDYAPGSTFNMPAGNVNLYAQWTPVPYTISYSGNGNSSGSTSSSLGTYSVGQSVTLGTVGDLEKNGYSFDGWNTAANGSGASYAAGGSINMPADNLILYAQWTALNYSVTYDGNYSSSGTVPSGSVSCGYQDEVTVSAQGDLAKTGYAFAGWNTADDGSGSYYGEGSTLNITENITLYAIWTANTYSVTYNGNGNTDGSSPSDTSGYAYLASVTVMPIDTAFVKVGCSFAGWNTLAGGTGTDYLSGASFTMPLDNVMLYAKWTALDYTVTYDANGSTGGTAPTDTNSYNYQTAVTAALNSGNLARTGFTFAGWNTLADGSGSCYSTSGTLVMPADNLTLYAMWLADTTYKIIYDGNGNADGSVPTDALNYVNGASATVLGNTGTLTKTGYTFSGWNTSASGNGFDYSVDSAVAVGTYDITLYAKWTENPTYSIEQIDNQAMVPLVAGYASSTPNTIDIRKTGTGDLNLSAALSGTNAGSFVLTQPAALDSETSTTSFTIKAAPSLAVGTYSATVTVSADNMTDVSFTVTQTVTAAPTYTIDSISDLTLTALTAGYASGEGESSITVTNSGSGDISGLSSALSGTNASSFVLTQPAAASLGSAASTTFTIKAAPSLAAGTYSATVTVSADNMTDVSFTVTQTVTAAPTYTIDSISDLTLTALTAGYASGEGEGSITVTNSGSGDISGLSVMLSGTDASSFVLTQPAAASLGSAASTTFTIKAAPSLAAGTYTATVYVTADYMTAVSFTVMQVVESVSSGGVSSGSSSSSGTGSSSDDSTQVNVNGQSYSAGTSAYATGTDGRTTTTVTVDTDKLNTVLNAQGDHAVVTIPVTTGANVAQGVLTGDMVKAMENKAATLVIQTNGASYTLPASEINIDAISSQLGKNVTLSDIKVSVSISEPSGATAKIVADAASADGFSVQIPAVDFTISCTYGGQTVTVSSFNSYVERMIAIPSGVDTNKITTGIVVKPDGTSYHVPTKVVLINGVYYAKISSLTNSTYTVVWHPIEFADAASHWAKTEINDLGSRMVVTGDENGKYNPDTNITRSEFAAIIVRALGLAPGTGSSSFGDVKPSDWYFGYVETASSYGIIKGYDANTFAPNDLITREQAMTMIARAMKITKLETGLGSDEANKLLKGFKDGLSVSGYALGSVTACVKTGVVNGRPGNTISPKGNVTRAEVAVMVERLLEKSGLI